MSQFKSITFQWTERKWEPEKIHSSHLRILVYKIPRNNFFYLTPFKTPYTHFERRHFEYWRLTPSGVATAYVQALIISAVERDISRMVRLLFVL